MEVELYQPDQDNVIIVRQFDRNNKSNWTINGKKSGIREVERKVAELRIQVDNLCQFLPQDKVHDFSRLDSKGLLNSTVDAVGDVSLKEQHAQLKELQKSMSEGEELYERKQQMLAEQLEKCRRLEEEVKAFDEKKKIEAKIKLAEERFAWSTFNEVGKVYVENKRSFEKCRAKFAKQEEKLDPIKEEIKEAGKKKATFDRRITELNGSLKDSTGKAKAHSSNIEKLELKVMQVDDEVEALETAEDKKKELIAREKNAIAEMEAEMSSTQDEGDIAPLCAEATRKVGVAVEAQQAKAKERDNLKYEQNHLRKQMDGRIDELRKLDDVEKMKLNKLKQLNSDAFEAVMWLRNNPGFFQHEVHEPLVMCANIHDVRNAKYIETCVNPRDMTSFFFASTDEMNRFLKICRNDRGWKKISAVTMPQKDLRDFVPHVAVSNLRNYDFISYVKDLVSVPDNVLSYLCHNYHLHRIPVFQAAADKFFDKFVNEMGFTKLFIGNYVHSVSGSLYSNAKSTMSKEVYSSRHLEIRKDDERETFLKNEIALYQEKLEKVETVLKQVEAAWQQCNLDLEAARKTKKELDQRRNYKSRQEGIIETKKKVLREMLAEVGSNRGREELKAKKKTLISQEVKSAQLLQVAIREANELRVKIEVVRLALQPLEEVHQKKTEELRESQDQMKGLKKELDSAEREFRVAKDTLTDAMKDAHKATGGYGSKKEEPPEEKKRQWEEEQIPSEHDEIQLYVGEMRARADCMESVDPRTIRDYNNTRENIQELQDDIQRRESRMTDKLNNLQTLKNAWVTSLTSLVSRISTNFSSHFQTMGFAGEVVLKTGDHENDFDNYGIRIRVKYRDSEPLQVTSRSLLCILSYCIASYVLRI